MGCKFKFPIKLCTPVFKFLMHPLQLISLIINIFLRIFDPIGQDCVSGQKSNLVLFCFKQNIHCPSNIKTPKLNKLSYESRQNMELENSLSLILKYSKNSKVLHCTLNLKHCFIIYTCLSLCLFIHRCMRTKLFSVLLCP